MPGSPPGHRWRGHQPRPHHDNRGLGCTALQRCVLGAGSSLFFCSETDDQDGCRFAAEPIDRDPFTADISERATACKRARRQRLGAERSERGSAAKMCMRALSGAKGLAGGRVDRDRLIAAGKQAMDAFVRVRSGPARCAAATRMAGLPSHSTTCEHAQVSAQPNPPPIRAAVRDAVVPLSARRRLALQSAPRRDGQRRILAPRWLPMWRLQKWPRRPDWPR